MNAITANEARELMGPSPYLESAYDEIREAAKNNRSSVTLDDHFWSIKSENWEKARSALENNGFKVKLVRYAQLGFRSDGYEMATRVSW